MTRSNRCFLALFVVNICTFRWVVGGFSIYRWSSPITNAHCSQLDSVERASVGASASGGRINAYVRRLMEIIVKSHEDNNSDGHGNWTRTRNYLYRSSSLNVAQVERVVHFLQETFPDKSLQAHILQSSPRILRKNVKTNLEPTTSFLRSLYGEELFQQAVRRNPDLLLTRGTGYDADALDLVEVYLRQDIQLSHAALDKLKRNNPFVFSLPLSKLLQTVNYLKQVLDMGNMDEGRVRRAIGKIITIHPKILQLSVETNIKPRLDYLQERCKLQDADLGQMLQNHGGVILGLSVEENLKPTVDFLEEYLEAFDLGKCVLTHPPLLALSLSNLKAKADYFDRFDGERPRRRSSGLVPRILMKAPSVFSLSLVDNIAPKVDLLARVWGVAGWQGETYNAASISALNTFLSEDPSILTLSLEGNLRPTINFYNRTGYVHLDEQWSLLQPPAATLLRPRCIAASLFQRLLPRWHFCLDQTTQASEVKRLLPLHILVSASDRVFCDFLGVDMDAYQQFKIESVPRLKFSSQFDTWLKTGRPIDIE